MLRSICRSRSSYQQELQASDLSQIAPQPPIGVVTLVSLREETVSYLNERAGHGPCKLYIRMDLGKREA
jgi:hypothetical protein